MTGGRSRREEADMVDERRLLEAFSRLSGSLPARLPVSTYRLQFNRDFRFADALAIIPYLNALGVTDIYSSPYFRANEGSTHGYDIIEHDSINPEAGGEEDFGRLSAELRRHEMGLIMDIVPNHMSIASNRNAWWQDILENGPNSPYARFFDIDWKPVKGVLEDKLILPVLGGQYGLVLENRELGLSFEGGGFFIAYYEHRLPVDPSTYTSILTHRIEGLREELGGEDPRCEELLSIVTALGHLPGRLERDPEKITERLREKEIIKKRIWTLYDECPEFASFVSENVRIFNGERGVEESFDLLDDLLGAQVYRLAYWQVATEEINYRRFFDINDLAAIRTEDPEIFHRTHRMVLRHIGEGKITGLRVDHPDGLHNPLRYFMRLQEECFVSLLSAALDAGEEDGGLGERIRALYRSAAERSPAMRRPFYIVGEKILMDGERIPLDWPVFGTTGYVFMNSVNGLFVSHANSKIFTGIYARFARRKINYPELVYEKKKLTLESSMASEINVMGHSLNNISESNRRFRDFTLNSLIDAMVETIAFFPVYRTYIDADGVTERDLRYIESAIARAKHHRRDISGSVFDFLKDVLILRCPEKSDESTRRQWLDFTMKFQQLTGPVMAKGLEDTVFYDYNRLVSLNEVGGNPERFGIPAKTFHGRNMEIRKHWPYTMVATSTHDSKRSEDVRARINVLSELPYEWREYISRWGRINKRFKTALDGRFAPDRNDEYLIYQTLLGSWPHGEMDRPGAEAYRQRIKDYIIKAAKEAKINTSWISPNAEYEEALKRFIEGVMASQRFLEDFRPLREKAAHYGIFNSLSQVLLKITSPGVPDFYQGSELWNLTLVDPDNRRPVDYSVAGGMIGEIMKKEAGGDRAALLRELIEDRADGRIKLYLTWKALNFRRANSGLFLDGDYIPLYAEGGQGARVVAFRRARGEASSITVAPRFLTGLITRTEAPLGEIWRGTYLILPGEREGAPYRDAFTGKTLQVETYESQAALPMERVLEDFPVALLEGL